MMSIIKLYLHILKLFCVCALTFGATHAQAATITLDLNTIFSDDAIAPDGPSPWATITLDDGGGTGSVVMTVDIAPTVGAADMDQLYLNLDDVFDVTALVATYTGTTGPAATGVSLGSNAFQSDGDGRFDIFFNFPNGGDRFSAGESVSYTLTLAGITASSFNIFSDVGGGQGTYLAASHWLSTGDGSGSAWIGSNPPAVVPLPASVWLFGTGLIGLVAVSRRERESLTTA